MNRRLTLLVSLLGITLAVAALATSPENQVPSPPLVILLWIVGVSLLAVGVARTLIHFN